LLSEDLPLSVSCRQLKRLFPQIIESMMASLIKDPFDSPDWIFETKLNGFRIIAVIDSAGKARIWSRNHLPLEPKFR
jgi:bifunctional non-homologous end joining protein LigD